MKIFFCYHYFTMYAIIETGGKQYWIAPGEVLRVEKLPAKEGEEITLKALWGSGENKQSGEKKPTAKVTAEVLRHLKGEKVVVFRKKPKKAYEKARGHRQELTEIKIKDIHLS